MVSQILTPTAAQLDPDDPAYWEWVRAAKGEQACGPQVDAWFRDTILALAYLLDQSGMEPDGTNGSLLDVSAGNAVVGKMVAKAYPKLIYHATEQSEPMVRNLQVRYGIASTALWRCEANSGPESLREALAFSSDVFEQYYGVVLLNHVVDCVDHKTRYRMLDACWQMVRPGNGFLCVGVQRLLEHRVHPDPFDWDKLVGTLTQYSRPIICFDSGLAGNLVAAVWRPPLGTPTYPYHPLPGEDDDAEYCPSQ